jgi:hypothetical protein
MSRRSNAVGLIIIAIIVILIFVALNLLWFRDNQPEGSAIVTSEILREDSTSQVPISATSATTPAITDAATTTKPAARAEVQIQVTEPIPPPAPVMPVAIPGDCGSWQAIFRWFGATDEEIYFFFVSTPWGRKNVIYGETLCGTRFRNPDTSDTGICQLNGVHRPWVMAEFGLRIGSGVSEAEASNPYYAAACLFLLRGLSHEPNAFGLACAWRTPRFCGS